MVIPDVYMPVESDTNSVCDTELVDYSVWSLQPADDSSIDPSLFAGDDPQPSLT